MRSLICIAACALFAASSAAAAAAAPASSPTRPEYHRTVFLRGAAIHGANGIAIDARGRLIVGSVPGSQLVVLDRKSGRILQRLGHEVGVDSPDDVALGPDGSIYWTDLLLGQVGRLAPNGAVTKQSVAPGMNPIAFTPDGRLFVGQAFGDGLYELDPDLTDAPRVVIPDSGDVAPWRRQLNGFDFGPDGMLYAPQSFLGRVLRIDPETGATTLVTDLAGAFPTSVEFDAHGRLHASLTDGRVVRIDRHTGAYEVVAEIPNALLDNIVFGPDGTMYVTNYESGAVYAVRGDRRVRTLRRGGLILPTGLAVATDDSGRESLFVGDVWKLARFDARSGRLLDVDRNSLAGGGTVVEPLTVAPDGANAIVTSWRSNAVQLWNPFANSAAAVFTDFAVPLNAIRFQGDLVVAELGTGRVTRQDRTGARSLVAGGLAVPAGLAATDDDLWVADYATGIVWKLVHDGAVLPSPQLVAGGLEAPEGIAVDRDGSLLVLEAGAKRLSRIDPGTGRVTTVAAGLEVGLPGSAAAPPPWTLSGVAVARDGTIFVSGEVASVVYRLRPR